MGISCLAICYLVTTRSLLFVVTGMRFPRRCSVTDAWLWLQYSAFQPSRVNIIYILRRGYAKTIREKFFRIPPGSVLEATWILFLKVCTADAPLVLIVEAPHNETAATPWDRQSSFTRLPESMSRARPRTNRTKYDGINKFNILQTHICKYCKIIIMMKIDTPLCFELIPVHLRGDTVTVRDRMVAAQCKYSKLSADTSWYPVLKSRTLKGHPVHTDPFERTTG
jgi:hypothetical protein